MDNGDKSIAGEHSVHKNTLEDKEEKERTAVPSTEEGKRCPVCLNSFAEQCIAIPNGCNHMFCLDCLLEWSKNSCTCPVDRIKFSHLSVYDNVSGIFQQKVHVIASEVVQNSLDTICCQICRSDDDEDTLLLCDGCDLGYHCACLDPPLDEVPIGDWFCTLCQRQRDNLNLEHRGNTFRALSRTRAVERVRAEVRESRIRRSWTGDLRSHIDQIVDDILARSSGSVQISGGNLEYNTRLGKKSRLRTKHKKRKCFNRVCNTSLKRFNTESATGLSTLYICGSDTALEDCSSAREDMDTPSFLIAQKHRQLSALAMQFNLPLPSLLSTGNVNDNNERQPQQPIPDLLSHIISKQEVLGMPGHELSVQRNGNLLIPKCRHLLTISSDANKAHFKKSGIEHTKYPTKNQSTQESKSSDPDSSAGKSSSTSDKKNTSKESEKRHVTTCSGSRNSVSTKMDGDSGNQKGKHGCEKINERQPITPLESGTSKKINYRKRGKIRIKSVTYLPQKKCLTKTLVTEAYDPFSPTDEDTPRTPNCEVTSKEVKNIYNPFEPTLSDDEKHKHSALPSVSDLYDVTSEEKIVGSSSPSIKSLSEQDTSEKFKHKMHSSDTSATQHCFLAAELDMFEDPEQLESENNRFNLQSVNENLPLAKGDETIDGDGYKRLNNENLKEKFSAQNPVQKKQTAKNTAKSTKVEEQQTKRKRDRKGYSQLYSKKLNDGSTVECIPISHEQKTVSDDMEHSSFQPKESTKQLGHSSSGRSTSPNNLHIKSNDREQREKGKRCGAHSRKLKRSRKAGSMETSSPKHQRKCESSPPLSISKGKRPSAEYSPGCVNIISKHECDKRPARSPQHSDRIRRIGLKSKLGHSSARYSEKQYARYCKGHKSSSFMSVHELPSTLERTSHGSTMDENTKNIERTKKRKKSLTSPRMVSCSLHLGKKNGKKLPHHLSDDEEVVFSCSDNVATCRRKHREKRKKVKKEKHHHTSKRNSAKLRALHLNDSSGDIERNKLYKKDLPKIYRSRSRSASWSDIESFAKHRSHKKRKQSCIKKKKDGKESTVNLTSDDNFHDENKGKKTKKCSKKSLDRKKRKTNSLSPIDAEKKAKKTCTKSKRNKKRSRISISTEELPFNESACSHDTPHGSNIKRNLHEKETDDSKKNKNSASESKDDKCGLLITKNAIAFSPLSFKTEVYKPVVQNEMNLSLSPVSPSSSTFANLKNYEMNETDSHAVPEEISLEIESQTLDTSTSLAELSTPESPSSKPEMVTEIQNIQESLSYAEKFLEQSRKRWKERKKEPGAATLVPQIDSSQTISKSIHGAHHGLTSNRSSFSKAGCTAQIERHSMADDNSANSANETVTLSIKENENLYFGFKSNQCPDQELDFGTEMKTELYLCKEQTTNVDTRLLSCDTDHRNLADGRHHPRLPLQAGITTPHNFSEVDKLKSQDPTEYRVNENRFVLPVCQKITSSSDASPVHPIETVSGISHAEQTSLGQFDDDQIFENIVQMSAQVRPVSTLIEVPMNEAIADSDANTIRNLDNVNGVVCMGSDRSSMKNTDNDAETGKSFSSQYGTYKTESILNEKVDGRSVAEESILNPTQILNRIGLNPQQKSAAQNAILSIAELSKHLQLDKVIKTKVSSSEEVRSTSLLADSIESSAVEMYNKGKRQGLLRKMQFQEQVAEEAKQAIKPYYERREISKTEYKEIMRRAVNKICSSETSMEVNIVKTRRLIRRYIEKYQQKNTTTKKRMKIKQNNEMPKSETPDSPQPPKYQPLSPKRNSVEKVNYFKLSVGTPNLLKRETRKVVTLPDLPLPPPPPPPPPKGNPTSAVSETCCRF